MNRYVVKDNRAILKSKSSCRINRIIEIGEVMLLILGTVLLYLKG